MALSEKHRSSTYQGLQKILGDEETEALLSQFPARDLDLPVTKELFRAELAELRAEMLGEIHGGFREVNERLRQQIMWMAGLLVTGLGASAGMAAGVASLLA